MEHEEIIKHYGVLGMRWGVRRDRVTIRERLDSLKRERNWKKVLKEVDHMDTEEIKLVTKRVQNENSLKKLVKDSKAAKDEDRKDYIRRGNLTDDELAEKVNRLRAKDTFSQSVYDASKEQREFGERIVNSGSSIALKYATNQTVTGKDIYDAITSPDKKATDKLKDNLRERAIDELVKSLK